MTSDQLKAFLEKVKTDSELENKILAAADSAAVVSIAKEAGFTIAEDEYQSILDHFELESASGGVQGYSANPGPHCRPRETMHPVVCGVA